MCLNKLLKYQSKIMLFCSGASDGVIRVFSADPGRYASQEIQEIFEVGIYLFLKTNSNFYFLFYKLLHSLFLEVATVYCTVFASVIRLKKSFATNLPLMHLISSLTLNFMLSFENIISYII